MDRRYARNCLDLPTLGFDDHWIPAAEQFDPRIRSFLGFLQMQLRELKLSRLPQTQFSQGLVHCSARLLLDSDLPVPDKMETQAVQLREGLQRKNRFWLG